MRLLVSCYNDGDASAPSLFEAHADADAKTVIVDGTGYAVGANASYFAVAPGASFGIAVNETGLGELTSFTLAKPCTRISSVTAAGADPCFVAVHPRGAWALAANYSDVASRGSVAAVRVSPEGVLRAPTHVVTHDAHGPVAARQAGPHMHCAMFHPVHNEWAYAVDLGGDAVLQFEFDASIGLLKPHPAGSLRLPAGSGPRHIAFSLCGTLAFLTGELDNILYVLSVHAGTGALSILQSVLLLPLGGYDASAGAFGGAVYAAHVCVHPSGRYVLASTRGFDAIVVFKVRYQYAECV
jgi:6-phosphogluconolactonase